MTITEKPSPNKSLRKSVLIDTVVIHATGKGGLDAALSWLCKPGSGVSAHFVIGKDGTIYRLVAESEKAWHAGESKWGGRDRVNEFSIGIELVNDNDGIDPYPEDQIRSLVRLIAELRIDYPTIAYENIVGHFQVAPKRKSDPGPLFPWVVFASALRDLERGAG